MRIAHVMRGRCNPESSSGIDRVVYDLSRAQAALGHEVAVFAMTRKPALPIEGVQVVTHPGSTWGLVLSGSLGERLRGWKPDVTHIHSLYDPANTALGSRLQRWRMPYVVTPHGALAPYVLRNRPLLKKTYRALFERSYLNHAAFVHSLTDQEDLGAYGITAPVVRAPNGVNLADVPAQFDEMIIRRRFPAARGKRVFVALGRLDPVHKGLDLLIRAFSSDTTAHLPLFLVLVGPDHGDSRVRLERMVREAHAEDRVVFWGAARGREKFDLLAAADVFVQASRWEGISMAVLEALAVATPCLLSTAADPLGSVAAGDAGLVTAPDVDALAAAVAAYARMSEGELRARGERGRAVAEAQFEWKGIAESLVHAYARHAACR